MPMAQVDGSSFVMPEHAPATLVEALVRVAEASGDLGTTYVLADDGEDRQTYRTLLADAARVLSGLRAHGLAPGESVVLHCDDNRNFVTGFWACLLGGFVPTPIAVAPGYTWDNATTRRLRHTYDLLDRPAFLTDAALAPQVARLRTLWGRTGPRVLPVEELGDAEPATWFLPAGPDDPAVHLLTSGSTGMPKCVRHTHRTVVTRAYVNAVANSFGPGEVTLNFMPLDHVAGMVMHNLRDVVLQYEHVNARTASFIADPLRWFTWIERYRVTNTSAPNFVVTLVTAQAEEIPRHHWDLSSLRDITNGGESIVAGTTHEFLRLLAPHGMAPDVMRPAWGMSEMCGGVVRSTLHRDDEKAGVLTVDARMMGGPLRFLPAPVPGHPTFTEVGRPDPGTSVRIVGPDGPVLPEDHIGRLHVRGVTRMAEYHHDPAATRESTTEDGWFDTGDLGFVHDGRLVMTGREKDTIVVRSANYHCHEIESVVGRVDGVLPTFVAACALPDQDGGTDELVVFCVLPAQAPDERRRVVDRIAATLSREVGIRPDRVVPVEREEFPKTSAGKVERARLLADYQAGAVGGRRPDAGGNTPPWLYEVAWLPAEAAPGSPPGGTWLVLGYAGLAGRIRAGRSDPGSVIAVTPASGGVPAGRGPVHRRSEADYRIDPADPRAYAELLAAVRRDHGPIAAVVHAWAAGPVEEPALPPALSVLSLIQAATGPRPRLVVVTAGAHATGDTDPVVPVRATVNGLVRTADAETGPGWIRQVDLRPDDPDPAAAVLAELGVPAAREQDVVAHRDGRRLLPRLRPLPDAPDAGADRLRPGGLYLLTGGLGRIGRQLSRFLLAEYDAGLVLVGRSAAGDRAAALGRLGGRPGQVIYHRADVTDVAALRTAVEAAETRAGRPLDGVLHLAGADISGSWQDARSHLLASERPAEFERLYHAKVHGTEAVAALLQDRPHALLVLFSSVNGHFGGTAFGAYASASAFLPAFAQHWHRLGRPVQCQSWSLWAESGEAGPAQAAVRRRGFRVIEPGTGADLFRRALAHPAIHVLIGLDDGNEHVAGELDPAFRRDAPGRPGSAGTATAGAPGTVGDAPRPGGAAGDLERVVSDIWASAFDTPPVHRDDHFFALGGTSLTAIRLVERLNAALGCRLVVQHVYEYATTAELAAFIDGQIH